MAEMGPTDNTQNCSRHEDKLTVHHHSEMEHMMINIDCEFDRIHERNLWACLGGIALIKLI